MSVLLHTCCAPCATVFIERLKDITLFFFNPNLYPEAEYRKRLDDVRKLAEIYKIPLIEGKYDHEEWLRSVSGLSDEPENGRRCRICYQVRLYETARVAQEKGFKQFATTLTISPHKDTEAINNFGKDIGEMMGVEYLETDFTNEFHRSVELSKKYDLYRQNY